MNFKVLTPDTVKAGSHLILQYGPPKVGKSIASCTISEKCPAALPAAAPTTLDDVLIINYDKDGASSFHNVNLYPLYQDFFGKYDLDTFVDPELPEAEQQLKRVSIKKQGEKNVKQMETDLLAVVSEAAKQPQIKYIVIDTLSSYEDLYKHNFDPFDSLTPMELGAGTYQKFVGLASQLVSIKDKTIIVLAHAQYSEPINMGKGAEARAEIDRINEMKRQASAIGGDSSTRVMPSLQKKACAIYAKHATLYLCVDRETTGPHKGKRVFLTRPQDGCEAGNKIENGILPKEPANLRAILKKANLI